MLGIDPNVFTAWTNAGLLLVTLVFSAIAAIQTYRAHNPKPVVQVDLLERLSNTRGRYRVKVKNLGRRSFDLAGLLFPPDITSWAISDDGQNWSNELTFIPEEIDPGGRWEKVVYIERGKTGPAVLGIRWFRDGTASKPRFADAIIN